MNNHDYQKDGLIGLNYLIKYIRERNKEYLINVKENKDAIKFWVLVTLLQNNHELIFDEIDDDTLNELFTLKPIKKNKTVLLFDDGSVYDYGIGYKSNSNLGYRLEFKIIRNAIAHNDFEINNGIIHIFDKRFNYDAIMDYKWFETAIVCSLSNRNYQFKSGLNEAFLVSANNDGTPSKEFLFKTLEEKTSGIIKVTLTTNSVERACKSLKIKYKENLKFYNLFIFIKSLLQKRVDKYVPNHLDRPISDKEFINYITMGLKELNTELKDSFKLEYIPFTLEFAKDIINNENFDKLPSFEKQMEFLFDHYKRKYFPELENTLAYKYLMDIFIILDNNMEIDNMHELYLDDMYNLLIKSLGNLVFNSILSNYKQGFITLNNNIFNKYQSKLNYDFGHAKNYYKEYIKKLNNTLEDVKNNGFPIEKTKELSRIKERLLVLNQKIDLINKGQSPEIFFTQLRNIFAHGYCDTSKDLLKLYDKDINRYYYKYSKSKKCWEEKTLGDNPIIFNMDMSYETFMSIINDICKKLGYSLENINDNKLKF